MSWVTDILLLAGIEEQYPKSGKIGKHPAAIAAVNNWLKSKQWAPLIRLDERIGLHTESAFQACAYGGALNNLDIKGFLRAITEQKWEAPSKVLLLLKNEGDKKFSVYRMNRSRRLTIE